MGDENWSNRDGDGAFGDIDFSQLGTWVVTFKVQDNAGNANSQSAEDQIYIHIVDDYPPSYTWAPALTREADCRPGQNTFDLEALQNTDEGNVFNTPKVDVSGVMMDPELVVK